MSYVGTVLVLVIILFGTAASVLAIIAWWNRGQPGVFWFAIHVGLVALWLFFGLVGMVSGFESVTTLMHLVAGGLAFPVVLSWFLFILRYLGYANWLNQLTGTVSLLVFCFAYVLVYVTSRSTELLYTDHGVVEWLGFVVVDLQPTATGNAVFTVGFLMFFIGLALIVQMAATGELRARKATILGFAAAVPFIVAFLVILLEFPSGAPMVQLGATLSVVLYGFSLRQFDLLAFSPATQRIGIRRSFEELGAGVLVTDSEGEIIQVNEAARSMLDTSDEQLAGQQASAVLDRFGVEPDSLPALAETNNRYYRVTDSRIVNEKGLTLGRTLMLTDVTGRRLREQRLDVLDRVLRHNIRNKLTVVNGNVTITADQLEDPELAQRLDRAREAADELSEIADKARQLEKTIRSKSGTDTFSVRDTVTETIDAIDESATVTLDIDEELTVQTNQPLFFLIVENIVENAVVHNDSGEPLVEVRASETEDGVRLYVEDNGPGIPEHEVESIHRGGETALAHGSGLGLWLVNWGLARLRGDVEYEQIEAGTRVTVTVPHRDDIELVPDA